MQCIVCMDAIGQEDRSEIRNIFVGLVGFFLFDVEESFIQTSFFFKSQTMQFSFFKTINYFNISCIFQAATFMVNPMFTLRDDSTGKVLSKTILLIDPF